MKKEMDIDLKEGVGIKTAVDIAIFNQKGQILLGQRLAKAGFASWGFPGGHLRTNEKIKEAAQREIAEELGKEIQVNLTDEVLAVRENCIAPHFLHHLTIILRGNYLQGEPKVNEPKKCQEWAWFDLENLPSPLFSGIEETLQNYKTGRVLIVTDWEKTI